jgi:peptidoglycan/LPS O-acetylase OafA/YrhL
LTPSSHFPSDQIHSLNREVSLYLDVCRFLAAVMVFVSHAANRQISGGFLWQIGGFGEDAVAVFFVLSGFVIGYVTDVRETDARSYAVNRLARLYSVALPALVLTFLLDAAGTALRPEFYSPAYIAYGAGDQPWRAAAGLLFLNEIWNTHTVMGSNGPYWSMGFEVCYYIAFGLAVFGPARWRIPACLLALVIAGPKIASLFPLWLGGVALFHFMKRASLPAAMGWLLFLGAPVLFLAVHALFAGSQGHMFAPFAFTAERMQSVLYFTALGALFAAHIAGFGAVSASFARILNRHARVIRAVAGTTFALYLFHMPVMLFVAAASPWDVSAWPTRLLVIIVPLATVVALSFVTERRKDQWRGLFERVLRPPAAAAPSGAPRRIS